MYQHPLYHDAAHDQNVAFVRDRSFGTLMINGAAEPLAAHIPFQLSEDGTSLEAHLVRSNPIVRALREPQNAVLAVSGGDGYISPDWYEEDGYVPTWNYVAVHLRGIVQVDPPEMLRGVLERISDAMEARLLPKPIWKLDKLTTDAQAKMMRMIVPISMKITDMDGTWKLSQNKSDAAQLAAGSALQSDGFGLGFDKIADLMTQSDKKS